MADPFDKAALDRGHRLFTRPIAFVTGALCIGAFDVDDVIGHVAGFGRGAELGDGFVGTLVPGDGDAGQRGIGFGIGCDLRRLIGTAP